MKKNVGTHESNMRMVAGALIVLFALFLVDEPIIKILLATAAAILAGTAFLHYCPINALLKRNTSEESTSQDTEEEESSAEEDSSNDEKPEDSESDKVSE